MNIAKSSQTIRTTSAKTEINKKVRNLSPNGNTTYTFDYSQIGTGRQKVSYVGMISY